jgi:N-methylhydantoinase A
MHAAAIAELLGMTTILCPRASGVLSALGLCASERRRDTGRTVMLGGEELTADRIASEVATLEREAGAGLDGAELRAAYELRYRGQAFELSIPGPPDPDPAELAERFAEAHEARYGYRDPDGAVELVNVRLAIVVPGPEPRPAAASPAELHESERRARFAGGWHQTRILRGEPPAGLRASGPVIFELPEATLVLPPGWGAEVDGAGTIIATAAADDG